MKNMIDIFIVEDNKILSQTLKADIETTFAQKDVRIHLFESGGECIERFSKEKPPIVILDYHLDSKKAGAMDGIKVLDKLKKENSDVDVIMLTSEDNIAIAIKSFHHGASDYIVKSETQYKKINNSLFHLIKMREAKREAKRYKRLAVSFFLCISLIVVSIVVMQVFAPFLLR